MVCILKCHKNGNAIILFIFLSVLSLTHLNFLAQGRVIRNHIDLTQKLYIRENQVLVTRNMIGSRPPRCEKKCRNCEHCKAVQVPIAPNLLKRRQHETIRSSKLNHNLFAVYSRGDDISNYKPMCWKCQCGNSFFNP